MVGETSVTIVLTLFLLVLAGAALAWFMHTDLGLAVRATGENQAMIRSLGVDTDRTKLIGLGLSNGAIALSGALVAQDHGFADIGMGIGILVTGAAAVMIGEALFGDGSIERWVVATVVGVLIYRFLVALALRIGLAPVDLKLITGGLASAGAGAATPAAETRMSRPMLALHEVGKTYMEGTADVVRALDRVSLTLAAGDFVTVIGSNGAGKSTLLNAIAGLVLPGSGRIELDGEDITVAPVHHRAARIGRIAQNPLDSTCASMSIAENLAMAARRGHARGLRRAVTAARAIEFRRRLAEVGLGLEQRADARIGTLSGGQRQAVALLMATIAGPRLLLLDEHLANLDPRTATVVMALTGQLVAAGGLTTLMVTHNMAQAIRWGNRLVMMHAGRIIFEVGGAEKAALTVEALVDRFHTASGTLQVLDAQTGIERGGEDVQAFVDTVLADGLSP